MVRSTLNRLAGALAIIVALMAALPSDAAAQGGRITGTVTDSARTPVAAAQVLVTGLGVSAETDAQGRFTLRGVAAGTHEVRVFRVGFRPQVTAGVNVTAGQEATVNVTLSRAAVQLGGVVVSASRRVEKITDAPATVTRIDEIALQGTIGNSFAPALKEAKGLDFIQVGLTSAAVNARGFNSSFNNRMLMTEDGRLAVLPENGLPVGGFTSIPKVDLGGVEVLVGPGSALYGPDASNGVITLQTKDARQYPGTTLEIAGGTRGFMDMQARHALTRGRWGFKVSGEYQSANDFEFRPTYPNPTSTTASPKPPLVEATTEFKTDVARGNGAATYYLDGGGRLELAIGASKSNAIGQTNVGRNQLINWGYRNAQLKFTGARWFAQVYQTQSLSGGTYQLNGFTQNRVRFPTISFDSVKHLSDFPADGRLLAAEVQNNVTIGTLAKTGINAIDNTHLIWGVQVRRDYVSSYRQWLSDRLTGEHLDIQQQGGYAQIETPLASALRLVVSGRFDKHENYEAQFSPKAAVLFNPLGDHTFRATYNTAFKSPTTLQTDFYFPNFQPFVGVFGNKEGWTVKNAAGAVTASYDAIRPELNTTWELGYKGSLANKLFTDVAVYRSRYKDFISPLVVIANPLAGAAATTAFNTGTGAAAGSEANAGPQIALIYFNLGEAKITGVDAGLRYYFSDRVAASGNFSMITVDTIIRKATDPVEATSFNSPSARVTAGMDFTDLIPRSTQAFTIRYVNKYDFRSGVNFGLVPQFTTLDLTTSYRLSNATRITAQVQNLYSCVGGVSALPANGIGSANKAGYTEGKKCGLGQPHQEMINTPSIGTILMVGFRWDHR